MIQPTQINFFHVQFQYKNHPQYFSSVMDILGDLLKGLLGNFAKGCPWLPPHFQTCLLTNGAQPTLGFDEIITTYSLNSFFPSITLICQPTPQRAQRPHPSPANYNTRQYGVNKSAVINNRDTSLDSFEILGIHHNHQETWHTAVVHSLMEGNLNITYIGYAVALTSAKPALIRQLVAIKCSTTAREIVSNNAAPHLKVSKRRQRRVSSTTASRGTQNEHTRKPPLWLYTKIKLASQA